MQAPIPPVYSDFNRPRKEEKNKKNKRMIVYLHSGSEDSFRSSRRYWKKQSKMKHGVANCSVQVQKLESTSGDYTVVTRKLFFFLKKKKRQQKKILKTRRQVILLPV